MTSPPVSKKEEATFIESLFKRNSSGVLSASVLVVLTLIVFYRLQMFGPTSAIHQFNQAVAKWDTHEIRSVTVQKVYDRPAFQILNLAHNIASEATTVKLVNLQQEGNLAIVRVEYLLPNGEASLMLYVLAESHGIWKIDLDKSMQAMLRAMGYQ